MQRRLCIFVHYQQYICNTEIYGHEAIHSICKIMADYCAVCKWRRRVRETFVEPINPFKPLIFWRNIFDAGIFFYILATWKIDPYFSVDSRHSWENIFLNRELSLSIYRMCSSKQSKPKNFYRETNFRNEIKLLQLVQLPKIIMENCMRSKNSWERESIEKKNRKKRSTKSVYVWWYMYTIWIFGIKTKFRLILLWARGYYG